MSTRCSEQYLRASLTSSLRNLSLEIRLLRVSKSGSLTKTTRLKETMSVSMLIMLIRHWGLVSKVGGKVLKNCTFFKWGSNIISFWQMDITSLVVFGLILQLVSRHYRYSSSFKSSNISYSPPMCSQQFVLMLLWMDSRLVLFSGCNTRLIKYGVTIADRPSRLMFSFDRGSQHMIFIRLTCWQYFLCDSASSSSRMNPGRKRGRISGQKSRNIAMVYAMKAKWCSLYCLCLAMIFLKPTSRSFKKYQSWIAFTQLSSLFQSQYPYPSGYSYKILLVLAFSLGVSSSRRLPYFPHSQIG